MYISFTLVANCGFNWNVSAYTDVTSWFVAGRNVAAFPYDTGVAQVQSNSIGDLLTIKLYTGSVSYFPAQGSGVLLVQPPSGALTASSSSSSGSSTTTTYNPTSVFIAQYYIPELVITSEIRGHAYTHAKSTLKEFFNIPVRYDEDKIAQLHLEHAGQVNDSLIGYDNAVVSLVEGDSYYVSEYLLKANKLTEAWVNGISSYTLHENDLVIYNGDYVTKDANSGREWSCLGGDGQGQYLFNFEVSGLTYGGLPVAPVQFPVQIHIFGYNYTSDAITKYGNGNRTEAVFVSLADRVSDVPAAASTPIFTWIGAGTGSDNVTINLSDVHQDDIYITWPSGTDASNLEISDIVLVLYSRYGDTMTLLPGSDYVIHMWGGVTQIAITFQYYPFRPVFTTMSLTVNAAGLGGSVMPAAADLTKTYDIASVYVYLAQQGGGGTTVDGTVTAYSWYGLDNMTSVDQVALPANYTLGTTLSTEMMYFRADNGNGTDITTGTLVNSTSDATVYDGSGPDDKNIRLIGNTLYIATRINVTTTRTVSGLPVEFTKIYAGGQTLMPSAVVDVGLSAQPGYVVNWTDTWIYHEKWAWQPAVNVGWGGINVVPYEGKFEYSLTKGASQQFNASDSSVTWSLLGNVSPNTTISKNGTLYISMDEVSSDVAVIATSNTDKSIYGQGTVNVAIN
ncbi:hypothetical protein SBRCBS47491_001790 [Sporothrix bragantina]|uniref:Uncharacterized protein n=1 Tax=Sporothrix bragantina TaxID=671064 RepID=A0ABP0B1S6_9PEZI